MNKTNSLNIFVSNHEALLAATTTLPGWADRAEEVAEVANLAEARLDRMLMPRGKRKGIVALHMSKGPDARVYRFAVIGTVVTLRRAVDGWRVIGFKTGWADHQRRGKLQLRISSEQEAAAFEAMHAPCGIVVTRTEAEGAPLFSSGRRIALERFEREGTTQPRSRRRKEAP